MRNRIVALSLVVLAVIACITYAEFRSRLPDWWRNYGGGIPYVLFWIFLAHLFWPERRYALRICVTVVLVTTGLEFLQLWNPEPLATIRSTKIGVALLGNTFVWSDIPPYFLGGVIGYVVLVSLGIRNSQAAEK